MAALTVLCRIDSLLVLVCLGEFLIIMKKDKIMPALSLNDMLCFALLTGSISSNQGHTERRLQLSGIQ